MVKKGKAETFLIDKVDDSVLGNKYAQL